LKNKAKTRSEELLAQHHAEMARASAAAMEHHYQETIEICSELLTSGIYEELAASGKDSATDLETSRRGRAEARLLMATAMHYAEGHYEDIVSVLTFALDSPEEIQKDAFFTLGVVHLSFGNRQEAGLAMRKSLDIIGRLRAGGESPELRMQEREAREFLRELGAVGETKS
jgi:hypothetical protein